MNGGRANLPYALITVVALAVTGWYVFTQSPFDDAGAPGGTAATTAATTIPGDDPVTTTIEGATTVPGASTTLPGTPLSAIAVETIADGLSQPLFAAPIPGEDMLVVVERGGRIKRVDPATGAVDPTLFLDVVDKTRANAGIEVGLLGLAFHPDFEQNRRVFIYYTDTEFDAALVEYRVNANGIADPTSATLILEVDRLAEGEHRHNAGMMQFGPDGYLYVASGDNGQYDVNPQDPTTLKGAILRLDVDSGTPYTTPADNPWSDGSGAPEAWAIGFRNPWRFSIDAVENTMYIGDVGQATWEEINAVPLEPVGYNFGWPQLEGNNCWSPATNCQMEGMTMPVVVYDHSSGDCSVTAGYAYRGAAIPELTGHFFFSDWCSGFIRSFRLEGGEAGEVTEWDVGTVGMITSFGLDAEGELLVTTHEGLLGRIVPVR